MKRLLLVVIFLLPMTVYASMPLYGSASALVENQKGVYIFSTEDEPALEVEPVVDELISIPEFNGEENLIANEPDLIAAEPDLIVDETEE